MAVAERGEPIRIGVRELRGKLGDYLRQARLGARFVIVSRGEPVAELGAPSQASEAGKPRQAGLLKGQIWMAEDFDEWPEGFVEAMENGPIEPSP
jgi:antitoxin (DNA-binding transcriptional repressor) of toxin-antitoxin stability system